MPELCSSETNLPSSDPQLHYDWVEPHELNDNPGSKSLKYNTAGVGGYRLPLIGARGRSIESLPSFIGVGPPRTATTWLHEALSGHVGLPEGVKETDFFVYNYDRGLEWYAAHFRNCRPDLPIVEFSPNYFLRTEARERIAKDIPHCKIICTLRDPVERTYSHYRKMREEDYFSGTFEECLEKRPKILDWGMYATIIKDWARLFETENILVLIQEDLKVDPQNFLNQASDFIGIPRIQLSDSQVQSKLVNAIPRLPRNPRMARIARKVRDRMQRGRHYALVNFLKKIGLRDLFFGGGPSFESMRPETDARLREYFRSEVEALEKMLNRDLSKWKSIRSQSPAITNS